MACSSGATAVWDYRKQGSDWVAPPTSYEQSPIALNDKVAVEDTEHLFRVSLHLNNSGEVQYSVENNGHSIQISAPSDKMGWLEVRGERFDFAQFHFHSPAEHVWTRDAHRRPLELHIVHRSRDDPTRLAVVGITFVEGEASPQAEDFFAFMKDERFPPAEGKSFSYTGYPLLRRLAQGNEEFLSYMGSLTTPPCTDRVCWFVMNKAIKCSREILTLFETTFRYQGTHGNYREIQNNSDGTPGKRNTQQVYRVTMDEVDCYASGV